MASKGRKRRRAKSLPGRPGPLVELEARRAREARAIFEIWGSVGLPVVGALKRLLAVVARMYGPRTAFVLLYDPVAGQLNVASARGREDGAVVAVRPGDGPIGEAFSTGEIRLGWVEQRDRRRGGRVKVDDPLLRLAIAHRRETRRSLPPGTAENGRRLVAIPMRSTGRCVGVLVLVGPRLRDGRDLAATEADLLLALGAQGAAAVEIARLRDDALRRSRDLETALAGARSVAASRDEALGTIAHELRTPLATIKGYLSILQDGGAAVSPREAIAACLRATDRIGRLIQDLVLASHLHAARMELDPKPIGLKSLLAEAKVALADLGVERGVRVHLRPGPEAFVRGNRDRLLDVVVNVLDNAVRYNRVGGEVRVGIESRGSVARLCVEDDGPGIPPGELRHIFDRYLELPVSPHGGGIGVGLGLSLVRQVVERHGGRVEMQSEQKKGTRCVIDLPLFAGVASGHPEAAAGGEGDGRILLVEDDADCRDALQLVLQGKGYRVEAASGGRAALAALGRSRPGLMLLDLHMPDLDGRLLLRRIRKDPRLADLPVFVISGAIDAAAGIDRLAPGAQVEGIFEKPLNFPRLLEALAGRVARSGGEA